MLRKAVGIKEYNLYKIPPMPFLSNIQYIKKTHPSVLIKHKIHIKKKVI